MPQREHAEEDSGEEADPRLPEERQEEGHAQGDSGVRTGTQRKRHLTSVSRNETKLCVSFTADLHVQLHQERDGRHQL